VPAELGKLSALKKLMLNSCSGLTSVPAELGQLGALEKLDLCWANQTSVPAELGQLSALQTLELTGNKLTCVPAELGQLSALFRLDIGHNQLTSVPAELGRLGVMLWLNLNNNQLTSVPVELGEFGEEGKPEQLRVCVPTLNLTHNKLSSVPAELVERCKRRRVDIQLDDDVKIIGAQTEPTTPAPPVDAHAESDEEGGAATAEDPASTPPAAADPSAAAAQPPSSSSSPPAPPPPPPPDATTQQARPTTLSRIWSGVITASFKLGAGAAGGGAGGGAGNAASSSNNNEQQQRPVQHPRLDASAAKMWNMPLVSSPRYGHPVLRLVALFLLCAPWAASIWALTPLMSYAADYAVSPPPDREAYLHVGVGPGGTTLCRTRVYATPVARPAGASHNLTRPWHPVSYRLLYSLVAKELWAAGEDRAVDRVHFELTTSSSTSSSTTSISSGAPSAEQLMEESERWAWVERSTWATVGGGLYTAVLERS
jgi:hypothetical protein